MNIDSFARKVNSRFSASVRVASTMDNYPTVHWSIEALQQVTGLDDKRVAVAIYWLKRNRLAGGKVAFFLTADGKKWAEKNRWALNE